MPDTLAEQAIAKVKAEKPSQFTVAAYIGADGQLRSAVTYDRKWSNAWGLTAYAKAYWLDLAVKPHTTFEAGAELTKKF